MGEEFVGSGWAFPMRVDPTGKIALVDGTEEIEESIRLILMTAPGERPMRPEFGCAVHDYVFAPADASTAGDIAYVVRVALNRWEPRVDLVDVVVRFDAVDRGVLYVDVEYAVRGTNNPRNLVFPFYVIPPARGGRGMSLPNPSLDDRRFQDLVDDAKRMVQQRCAEWTDHNVSDPGVTLIETFAFMTDELLYRLNRVPDRLYITFLDLLGVTLHPPTPAHVDVTAWLSAPPEEDIVLPADSEVATLRTSQDGAVVFATTVDLVMPPRTLRHVMTQPAAGDPQGRDDDLSLSTEFACFSEQPAYDDVLLLGLDDSAPSCAIGLRFECHVQGVGVDPTEPPLVWEAWDGTDWVGCEVDSDGTGGLNRAGDVVIHVPRSHTASVIGSQRAGWLRCRVVPAVEGYPFYSASPTITAAAAFTLGGTVQAVHAETVTEEVLGLSEGVPGQVFRLARGPVVSDGAPIEVEVAAGSGWERWQEVESFAGCDAESPAFRIDRATGDVNFGPAVREPDGTLRYYGAVPPKGAPMRVPLYRVGGGPTGNVSAGERSGCCGPRSPRWIGW